MTSYILAREYGYSFSHAMLKVYIKVLNKCCGSDDINKSFNSSQSRKKLEENLII